jgi:hypothetical protein
MNMPGMLNPTPQWATIEYINRDYSAYQVRARRNRRKAQARKVTIGFVMALAAAAGVATGTILSEPPSASAISQVQVNRYIRDNGGIPPCTEEDGSGQPGPCYWDSRVRGNRKGDVIVLMPNPGGVDKRVVVLINR